MNFFLRPSKTPTCALRRLKLMAAFIATASISACVSTRTQMVNDQGQVANCSAQGWGWLGAPIAMAQHSDCVAQYQSAGYREVGRPDPRSTRQAQGLEGAPLEAAQTVAASMDGTFKLMLPEGWAVAPIPNASFQLAARNPVEDSYLLVSSKHTADITDWGRYVESLKKKLASNLSSSSETSLPPLKVNGYEASAYEVAGTLKNGTKVHYFATVIKYEPKLIYILCWTGETGFAARRAEFEAFPEAIKF